MYGTGGYMLSVNEALSYNQDAIGIGRKGTIDKPYILKAPFWTVDTLFYALPRENNKLDFLNCIFQKINWKSKDESTGVPSLSKTIINSVDIHIPEETEQTKIGSYFQSLDKLITLHQSKFEKLQKIKKSCLQNLFPQNNQNTPKIRFKNFSDEWENNNLGEICKIIKGEQINKLSLLENGKYYVLNGGISPSGYINTYNTLENTISISEGGNSCGYVKFNIEKFWSGGHNYTLNELKTKTLFLYSFLKAKQQKIMALRVGSGLPNIQKNTLSNISISIPNSKEQEKIGAFFSKLDKLISLQQRKVEKLKNIKKALLNKMFI